VTVDVGVLVGVDVRVAVGVGVNVGMLVGVSVGVDVGVEVPNMVNWPEDRQPKATAEIARARAREPITTIKMSGKLPCVLRKPLCPY